MTRIISLFAVLAALTLASCGVGASIDRDSSGFDEYGYNEVAGQFDGYYFNTYAEAAGFGPWQPGNDAAYLADNPGASSHWAWPYRSTRLKMKWNQDWDDGNDLNWAAGSEDEYDAAWITNHMWDSYEDGGETYEWNYFTKITWVGPAPAAPEVDPFAATRIWGQFAIIQEVYNDQGSGDHGNIPIPGPNGFGAY